MISRLKEKIKNMLKENSEYWKKINQQDLAETQDFEIFLFFYSPERLDHLLSANIGEFLVDNQQGRGLLRTFNQDVAAKGNPVNLDPFVFGKNLLTQGGYPFI